MSVTGPLNDKHTAGDTEDWYDPVLGARFTYPFNEKWSAALRGEMGSASARTSPGSGGLLAAGRSAFRTNLACTAITPMRTTKTAAGELEHAWRLLAAAGVAFTFCETARHNFGNTEISELSPKFS